MLSRVSDTSRALQKAASDYLADQEHKLHSGQWDWHSYVLKGKRQAPFREHCSLSAVSHHARKCYDTETGLHTD